MWHPIAYCAYDVRVMSEPNTTGIIICDHGSRRAQSNDSLKEVARLFAERFAGQCAIVEPAHMELAMPDIAASYAWVEVKLMNHAAKGITDKDFELAKKIEEVVQWQPGLEGGALEGTPSGDQRFAYIKYD